MPIGAPSEVIELLLAFDLIKQSIDDKPGWPELAFPTTSTARVRMVATATWSSGCGVKLDMVVSGLGEEI